jgi:hypothetical protein
MRLEVRIVTNHRTAIYDYSITQLVRQAEVSRFFARPAMLGCWIGRLDRIAPDQSGKRSDHQLNPAIRQG